MSGLSQALWAACELLVLLGAALFYVQEKRRPSPRRRWLLVWTTFAALAIGGLVVDGARLLTT